jgi:hypothetical protein
MIRMWERNGKEESARGPGMRAPVTVRQNKTSGFISHPNRKSVFTISTTPEPGEERENQAQNNHRGYGDVYFYAWPVYGDISG